MGRAGSLRTASNQLRHVKGVLIYSPTLNSHQIQDVSYEEEKEKRKKTQRRFFVCEALSVPGTALRPGSGTASLDPYKVCLTLLCSPLLQAVCFMSRIWCVSSGRCVSVVYTRACSYTCAQRKYFHQCCRILNSSYGNRA